MGGYETYLGWFMLTMGYLLALVQGGRLVTGRDEQTVSWRDQGYGQLQKRPWHDQLLDFVLIMLVVTGGVTLTRHGFGEWLVLVVFVPALVLRFLPVFFHNYQVLNQKRREQ